MHQLQPLNDRLIYCAVTGFGETGPLKDKAGYDQVLQTYSGMCDEQGQRGGPPEILYGSVVDYFASAMVAAGIASALYEREKSGRGQQVGVSLLRAALTMQSARLVWAEDEPRDVSRDMRSGGITGLHPTREGYLYLSANTPHFWRALCEKTGLMALHDDPRYDSVKKRAAHRDEIVPQPARGARGAHRPRVGGRVRRERALRRVAQRRRHVRRPAGAGRGDGHHARPPDARAATAASRSPGSTAARPAPRRSPRRRSASTATTCVPRWPAAADAAPQRARPADGKRRGPDIGDLVNGRKVRALAPRTSRMRALDGRAAAAARFRRGPRPAGASCLSFTGAQGRYAMPSAAACRFS